MGERIRIAKAIEANAGESLEGLRESLAQAKAGVFAEIHGPAADRSSATWSSGWKCENHNQRDCEDKTRC